MNSYESDGQPTEHFQGNQQINAGFSQIVTNLQSVLAGTSTLSSDFNSAGLLVSTMDTTDGSGSTTEYFYDDKRNIYRILNISSSAGAHQEKEEHLWSFKDGKPVSMLRIKNNSDTAIVRFVIDEKGNITEENGIRNNQPLPPYYYYYDSGNRLTDIVSYNVKAGRLLPDYVFEYNPDGTMNSMMVVPEGSSDYQKWYYEYTNGLKTRETAFNKRKQLLGKIEYHYN